ncbi:MAG: disulfide bond formation protein B [Proteobacteria bacterium]|nr:disulfide bond formation protein B [Pseudomonadota bacterium]
MSSASCAPAIRRRTRPEAPPRPPHAVDRRTLNIAGFAACAALLGYALYAQFQLGLEPCPLCIFQRIGVALAGVLFLLAALHNPSGGGRYVYAGLVGVAALATAGVAARHVYVQHLPPGSLPSCGAPLAILLKFTPVFTLIKKVLTGSGECGEVNWRFLGLAMPTWVLLCALALAALGLYANLGGGRLRPAGSAAR